jgi:hypothetical protein
MQPDPGRFPAYNDALRAAMEEETARFFLAIVQEDRNVLNFLDADFTFVNERLAKHYGIPDVKGDQFRKVTLKDRNRGGILTQASVLAVTSNPTRTSPVKRGKWILENVLGTPPPPPPPDAGELKEDGDVELTGSLRQRMELHREKASCAVCHQRMDLLGFGLENFDAIGAWRDRDGNKLTPGVNYAVGGNTKVWGAATLRMRPSDERMNWARSPMPLTSCWPRHRNSRAGWRNKHAFCTRAVKSFAGRQSSTRP